MFLHADWLAATERQLTRHLEKHWPAAGMEIEVTRNPGFDGNRERANRVISCELDASGAGGLIPFLHQMNSILAQRLASGRRVSCPDFHLRFWGTKWIGRVPRDEPYFGFGRNGAVFPYVPRGCHRY